MAQRNYLDLAQYLQVLIAELRTGQNGGLIVCHCSLIARGARVQAENLHPPRGLPLVRLATQEGEKSY